MSYDEIIQMILSSHRELSNSSIVKLIEAKQRAAKGFLTYESAARLVGAELGIKFNAVNLENTVLIKDLVSGLSDVTIKARIIKVNSIRTFRRSDGTEGQVRRLLVTDKTGKLFVVLWDKNAEFPETNNITGKTVKLLHGYIRRGFNGGLELNIGSRGAFIFL